MNNRVAFWKNPFITVMPVVFLLFFVWQQYSVIAATPRLANAVTNILPNAGLDDLDAQGVPIGWQVSAAESSTASTRKAKDNAVAITFTNANQVTRGNTTLTSPLATVKPGERYYYKTIYKANLPFDLILRTNNTDGSYDQFIVGRFKQAEDWEAASHVFVAGQGAESVQFIYSVTGRGELQIDRTYLEPNPSDLFQQPRGELGNNLVSNPQLSSNDGVVPADWSSFSYGNNQATFAYVTNDGASYLRSQSSSFKDGEAKWQYTPVAVSPHQMYQFTSIYRSDVPIDVIAEYTLSGGERRFETIRQLLPVKNWTAFKQEFEIPQNADSVVVTLVLRNNGYLDTRGNGLYNLTQSGPLVWDRPRLSMTFDDGWLSAFNNGASLLNRYGYEGTFYLNPSVIDTANFMTSAQVQALVDDGHEVASHGYKHLNFTTLDRSEIDHQLGYAAQYFSQVHGQSSTNFAAPFGGVDAQLAFYAHRYYTSLRGTDAGVNTKQNFDLYNIRVLYMGHSVTPARLADEIADAKASNGWLVLVYHRIEPTSGVETIVTPTQLQQQLDSIKRSGIVVEPVSTALQEIDSQ
ncbi:MAG TPA: polysaccharide deacetylase family protein [Candidatus Saccharimonadales bacterium]